MIKPRFAALSVALFACAPALAHHSFAMFDQSRTVTLKGTVSSFQFTNPHSWLEVAVIGDKGDKQTWSIEMLSPNVLGRMGWKKNSVVPGQAVTAVIHPVKNGAYGGILLRVADTASGRQIGGPQP